MLLKTVFAAVYSYVLILQETLPAVQSDPSTIHNLSLIHI